MAQSRNFFEDVKKELECSVCQEQFSEINEPKILKCLHTFCKNCLEAWLRQQREGELSCPTCRQITECPNSDINRLPSNLFYKQMVEIVEAYNGQGQEDSPHCGNCEEKKSLKFYCSDCNCFLCDECAGTHKKWKGFRGHHIKEIGNLDSSDVQDYARKANVCKNHKDELRYFCDKCKICICRDCAILEHQDHNKVSFEQGLEKKKSDITNKMEEVEAVGRRLENHKESLGKRRIRVEYSIDQATNEVHRVAEHCTSLIRQHEATMTKELLERKANFQAELSAQMIDLDGKLVEIHSGLEFGKDVVERNNLPEILNVEELLEGRFQELLSSPKFNPVAMTYSEVKYVPVDTATIQNGLGKLFITKTEPSLSIAQGTGLTEGTQGEDCTFTIITKDSQGQTTYSEIDKVAVDIQSLLTGRVTKPSITDSKDGSYQVKYKPEAAGEFSVSITVGGEAISGSPFQLKVKGRTTRKKGKRESSGPSTPNEMPRSDLECLMCMNLNKEPVYPSQCGLDHYYCKSCVKCILRKTTNCPQCEREGLSQGNQPVGFMGWTTAKQFSLPGYEDCEVIVISFNFEDGIQGTKHPTPGKPYGGLSITAYLPSNKDGQVVCSLLKKAFEARLMFTIGKSPATREENKIVFNGIELKTSLSGGRANYGYPDSSYLDRVKIQLAEKGIK